MKMAAAGAGGAGAHFTAYDIFCEERRSHPAGNALTPTQLQDLWQSLPQPQKTFYEEASVAEHQADLIANARDLRQRTRDRWPSDTYVLTYAQRNGITTPGGVNAIRGTARAEFHAHSERLKLPYYRLWRQKAPNVVCHNASIDYFATASVSTEFEER